MLIPTISLIISLVTALIIFKFETHHNHITGDNNLNGPQKFHTVAVPRIGGFCIFSSLVTVLIFANLSNWDNFQLFLTILICSFPTFFSGVLEDLTKKINVKIRFSSAIFSGLISAILLNLRINDVGIESINYILSNFLILSILLTVIAIAGLTNAFNLIDGFNGLASMIGIISASAIGYIAYTVNDSNFAIFSFSLAASILGFFIWNYPKGLIFLGDGGAYLIGCLVAILSISLVNRNPTVSPWFPILVNIYPIIETLFTIWRRMVLKGKNPTLPDALHFHSLVYRQIIKPKNKEKSAYIKNAKTAPYLWLFSSLAATAAVIWHDVTLILQICTLLFFLVYLYLYHALIKHKKYPQINRLKVKKSSENLQMKARNPKYNRKSFHKEQ